MSFHPMYTLLYNAMQFLPRDAHVTHLYSATYVRCIYSHQAVMLEDSTRIVTFLISESLMELKFRWSYFRRGRETV